MDLDANLHALWLALQHSPDNVPLRRVVAQTLFDAGRHAEAERELLELLRRDPESRSDRLLLARTYRARGKESAAIVVLEALAGGGDDAARVELARALLAEGDDAAARRHYEVAIANDPELADEELDERLWPERDDAPDEAGPEHPYERRPPLASADVPPVAPTPDLRPVQSDIDFRAVGGLEHVKQEIRKKIVLPMRQPELYRAYGKRTGGGILLYGPPGCGKTFLARATAGEVKAVFLSVGIHEVLDMWIGRSERNLHAVFRTAREHRPCVLFFDEVDALGASRNDMKHSAGRQTINQFLAELDGIGADNDGVLVLAATNAPWHMDSAFRRPGRFDRVIFVPPPDEAARAEILRLLLRDRPQEQVDLRHLAKHTERFSGADLAAVVDLAVEARLDDALASGRTEPLRTKDLLAAARQHRPTTAEWLANARNYVLYANEGGMYDDLARYLRL